MCKNDSSSTLVLAGASDAEPIEQRGGSRLNPRRSMQGEIGFVGLGNMGTAMAVNLAAAGHRVIAYVRRPDKINRLTALGLNPTARSSSACCRTMRLFMTSCSGVPISASTVLPLG